MSHNRYWPIPSGTLVSPISPDDCQAIRDALARDYPDKQLLMWWHDMPLPKHPWADGIITMDAESHEIAFLSGYDGIIVNAQMLIGRDLQDHGSPIDSILYPIF